MGRDQATTPVALALIADRNMTTVNSVAIEAVAKLRTSSSAKRAMMFLLQNSRLQTMMLGMQEVLHGPCQLEELTPKVGVLNF